MLFLIIINDLPCNVKSKSVLYADDTTFLCQSNDLHLLNTLSDSVSASASEWFTANAFLLNENKTQHLVFSNKNNFINNNGSDSVKFLGMMLDCRLTWSKHVEFLSIRLSRVIYLLKNLTKLITPSYARCAYFSFFQSVYRYGLIFWGNCSKVKEILILQKKAIRILSKANRLDHCKPLFVNLEILTVINLYIFDVFIYTLNHIENYSLVSSSHAYSTRNNRNIIIPNVRLHKTDESYKIIGLKIYNKIPKHYYDLPMNVFKNRFYQWLLRNPFYRIEEFLNKPETQILL